VTALALGCSFFATAAAAQSDLANCSSGEPDRMIAGCSAIINRGAKSATRQRAGAFVNRGIAYYELGNLAKALDDYNSALKLDGKFTDAWHNRADVELRKGDLQAAITDYQKVTGLDPNRSSAYNGRGNALRESGKIDEAIADYDQAISLAPESPFAYNGRGNARRDKGDIEAAIKDYDRAIELNPRYATALIGRGNALRDAGRRADAIRDYDAAIALDPNDATAYNNRGTTYKDEGQFDRAIEDYTFAIGRDPARAAFYFNRALAYVGKDQADQAISDYSKTIEIDKNHAFAYHNRGLLFFQKRDFDRAIGDYANAIRINPRYAQYYRSRGTAYLRKGEQLANNDLRRSEFAKAVKDFQEGLRLDDREPAANMGLAEAYEKMGQYADARKQIDRAITLDPASATALLQRGRLLEHVGDLKQASKDYEEAGSLDSGLADLVGNALETIKSKLGFSLADRKSVPADPPPISPSPRLNRVALIIGNGNYGSVSRLPNAKGDARMVADAFRNIGFRDVIEVSDQTREQMLANLRRFQDLADNAEWAVIYYAGHGLQIDGVNYIVPTDARLTADRDVPDEAIPLSRFLSSMDHAQQLKLVILDACRDNPFLKGMKVSMATRSIERGLARISPTGSTYVAYAAMDGQVALDGQGEHSPFVAALVPRILTPGLDIRRVFGYVRDDVLLATGRQQRPATYGDLGGDDYIINPPPEVRMGDSKL
jgi:tetratricopeptide (TPR) repeat protein